MSLTPRLTMIGLYNYDNTIFDRAVFPEGIEKDFFINSLLMRYGECPTIYPNAPFFKNAVNVWSQKWYHSIERILAALNKNYEALHNYDRTEEESGTNAVSKTGGRTENGSGTDSIATHQTDSGSHDSTITKTGSLDREENGEGSQTKDTTLNIEETTETQVSAYNASDYQPKEKVTKTGEDTTSESTENESTLSIEESTSETVRDTGLTAGETNGTENRSISNSKTVSETGSESGQNTRSLRAYGNIGVTTSQEMLIAEIDLRMNHNIYDIISELFYREFCIYVY